MLACRLPTRLHSLRLLLCVDALRRRLGLLRLHPLGLSPLNLRSLSFGLPLLRCFLRLRLLLQRLGPLSLRLTLLRILLRERLLLPMLRVGLLQLGLALLGGTLRLGLALGIQLRRLGLLLLLGSVLGLSLLLVGALAGNE